MKPVIDRECCEGCGMCTYICPELFAMDSNSTHKVHVKRGVKMGVAEFLFCSAALQHCPVRGIRFVHSIRTHGAKRYRPPEWRKNVLSALSELNISERGEHDKWQDH